MDNILSIDISKSSKEEIDAVIKLLQSNNATNVGVIKGLSEFLISIKKHPKEHQFVASINIENQLSIFVAPNYRDADLGWKFVGFKYSDMMKQFPDSHDVGEATHLDVKNISAIDYLSNY